MEVAAREAEWAADSVEVQVADAVETTATPVWSGKS
jgi:hypothetical protein